LKEDKDTSFGDIAILTRTNDTAGIFCRALERKGLPYDYVVSSGLYNKAIILDSVAYFKLLDNYHESSAMYRILNLPFLKISYDDIVAISRESKRNGWSIFEGLHKGLLLLNIFQRVRKRGTASWYGPDFMESQQHQEKYTTCMTTHVRTKNIHSGQN